MIRLLAIVAFLLVPMTSALAIDYPRVECALSDDASRVSVLTSNPTPTAFTCAASCPIKVTGQRKFEGFNCRFSLAAGAAEKAACTKQGSGPAFFSTVGQTKVICTPRK